MKLKVCGLKDPENIKQVLALSPDYIGFIFYKKSLRYAGQLDPQFVASLSGAKKVGVFVNETAEAVLERVHEYGLDVVQLHGEEAAGVCDVIRKRIGVIKVFRVDHDFDFASVNEYEGSCDYFLFDSNSSGYGGSGLAFDHTKLRNFNSDTPYFLSGGISLDNIGSVDRTRTFCVDVNSKFESAPGVKDIQKLKILKEKLPA